MPRLGTQTNEAIMPNLQIEHTPLHALHPQRQNARTHSKRQIRFADSIERFGFCNPILIDDDRTILAGHGRVKAAELLGLAEVPTVRLSHLSDAVLCDCRQSFSRESWLGSRPAGD